MTDGFRQLYGGQRFPVVDINSLMQRGNIEDPVTALSVNDTNLIAV